MTARFVLDEHSAFRRTYLFDPLGYEGTSETDDQEALSNESHPERARKNF